MASYSAVIDIRANGLQQLTTVAARVGAINKLIKEVKPIPNIFDQRDVARVKAVKKELDFVVKAYADGNTVVAKFSGSIAGLNSQLNGFRTVAANAKVGADQFTNALKAAEIASSKLAGAELKRLDTLGDLYTRKPTGGLSAEDQGPSGLTRAVLDLGKTLPKSLAGLRTYANELDRIFTLVEAGSVDFRTLQAEIARVNRQMDIAGGAGPMQGPALPPSMRGGGGRRGIASPIGGGPNIPGSPAALRAASTARGKLMENLMLGAGFPLLFGGGPGQVLGGLAGSFVGPGFGGQILFSALFGQLEQLGVAATEAGNALRKPIENFSLIEQRGLLASESQERYVKNLIDSGQYIQANTEIQKRYNQIVGAEGSKALLELSESSDRLTRAWAELSLQIQAALAGPLAGFLEWVTRVVKGVSGPPEARTLKDFMQQLTPEQQKQYLTKSRELAKQFDQGKAAFEGTSPEQIAAIKKLQQEFLPGFGESTQKEVAASLLTNEVKLTAELERRSQLQALVTKYRESELTTTQQQLQQDITLLSKQQEFATSLNQQAALIDKIATKKQQSADLEYIRAVETQRAEIESKQIAYERLQLDAQVAEEKLKQDKVSQKLLESDKQSLQATIDKLPLAEKELELLKQAAANAINRAASDNQTAKYLADIEARQQKVAAYAADAARQTEAFSRAANEAVNTLNNNLSVIQAYSQAQQTINNLQIQELQNRLEVAKTTGERLDILYKIRDLEVLNARIALNATRAQIKAEVERQRIALALTEQKYKQLKADVAMAKAQGVLNQNHLEALANQQSALNIATDNYNTSIKVASEQWRAADAVYEAAVRAADFKVSMQAAATAAQQTADAATTTAKQTAAAADFSMGATQTFAAKALPPTAKQLRDMQDKLGGMLGLNASYYGQDEETIAAMKARSQQQQEAMAQQMADNLQRLRSVPAERDTGSSGPINIQTGPVLQQDGKKYVTLDDMESAIQSMASTMYSSNRSTGTRRFTGVR